MGDAWWGITQLSQPVCQMRRGVQSWREGVMPSTPRKVTPALAGPLLHKRVWRKPTSAPTSKRPAACHPPHSQAVCVGKGLLQAAAEVFGVFSQLITHQRLQQTLFGKVRRQLHLCWSSCLRTPAWL